MDKHTSIHPSSICKIGSDSAQNVIQRSKCRDKHENVQCSLRVSAFPNMCPNTKCDSNLWSQNDLCQKEPQSFAIASCRPIGAPCLAQQCDGFCDCLGTSPLVARFVTRQWNKSNTLNKSNFRDFGTSLKNEIFPEMPFKLLCSQEKLFNCSRGEVPRSTILVQRFIFP